MANFTIDSLKCQGAIYNNIICRKLVLYGYIADLCRFWFYTRRSHLPVYNILHTFYIIMIADFTFGVYT